MRKVIKSQSDELQAGESNQQLYLSLPQSDGLQAGDSNQQYLVFKPVTEVDLGKIDRARNSNGIGKHIRMTHCLDSNLLIIKLMPSAEHEAAHGNLAKKFLFKIARMGVPENEIYYVGATRIYGRSVSKEGDSAFKPLPP